MRDCAAVRHLCGDVCLWRVLNVAFPGQKARTKTADQEALCEWDNHLHRVFLLRCLTSSKCEKDFSFCIPFDLVHLIQAFEAEPEAPVFEFPFDLELENPWTGKKILDYHHTFKLDMSDYEPVIKIFRIFEIIFFIIGLLMITRQQMIKG